MINEYKSTKIDALIYYIDHLQLDLSSTLWSEFCNHTNLRRYLTSCNDNVEEAFEKFKYAVNYRSLNIRPGNGCNLCQNDNSSHCMISLGIGHYGLGIVYICPGRATNMNVEALNKHLIIEHDKCFLNQNCCGKAVWVVDFNHYSLAQSIKNPKVGMEFAKTLSNCLPERIHSFILINPPYYFIPILKLGKMFMDSRTINKIVYCYDNSGSIGEVIQIDVSNRPNDYNVLNDGKPKQGDSILKALSRVCNQNQIEWINNMRSSIDKSIILPLPNGSPRLNSNYPFD